MVASLFYTLLTISSHSLPSTPSSQSPLPFPPPYNHSPYPPHIMNNKNKQIDYLFKIVLIGDSNVGKTNILAYLLTEKMLPESKPTIGVEFGSKVYKFGDDLVKVQIWDTAGQERYHAITSAYYRGTNGAIVVYDVTNKNSLKNSIEIWLSTLKKVTNKEVPVMLLGNKNDLEEERKVNFSEGKEKAISENLGFYETSALTGDNISKAFEIFIREVYDRERYLERNRKKQKIRKEGIKEEESEGKKKKTSCC